MEEVKVYCNLGLIGDCIAAMPFLHELSKTKHVIAGPNLNRWVLDGIDFPIAFDSELEIKDSRYVLEASRSWAYCAQHGSKHHMAQGHFLLNGLEAPSLPYSVPLELEECNLDSGIIIAPFSVSDHNGNKFWPVRNWIELAKNFPDPVYVVGSSKDDFNWTLGTNVWPIAGRSMAFVSSLLKKSKMLVSIDTGISHLAHMLGIKNHALLYSPAVPPNFVANPWGTFVYDFPSNVKVETMLQLCQQVGKW
jgi:ADP-heptose:LPS heptosyltransferase